MTDDVEFVTWVPATGQVASGAPLEWDFSQLHKLRDGRTYWARAWASHEEGIEAAGA